jgi:hypothetical protein
MMDILFLPFLFVAVVSLIVGVVFGLLVGRSKARSDDAEVEPETESAAESPPPDALYIWRNPETKDFVLQFGERVYRSSDDLTPKEKETFSALFRRMQTWLGVSTPPQGAPPIEPISQPKGEKPSITAAGVVSSLMPSAPEPPPTSIVAQIDEILQKKLAASPLKDRGIALQETIRGGMQVVVGLEKYEDIDSVPEEEIRVIIRASVAEWEKQS